MKSLFAVQSSPGSFQAMSLSPVTCWTSQFISSVISALSALLDPLLGKICLCTVESVQRTYFKVAWTWAPGSPLCNWFFSHAERVSRYGVRCSSSWSWSPWSSSLHFGRVASVAPVFWVACPGLGGELVHPLHAMGQLSLFQKLQVLPSPWKVEMWVCYQRRKSAYKWHQLGPGYLSLHQCKLGEKAMGAGGVPGRTLFLSCGASIRLWKSSPRLF